MWKCIEPTPRESVGMRIVICRRVFAVVVILHFT